MRVQLSAEHFKLRPLLLKCSIYPAKVLHAPNQSMTMRADKKKWLICDRMAASGVSVARSSGTALRG